MPCALTGSAFAPAEGVVRWPGERKTMVALARTEAPGAVGVRALCVRNGIIA